MLNKSGKNRQTHARMTKIASGSAIAACVDCQGYLWKKSPNPLRAKAFERRFFIISHTQIAWWVDQEASKTRAAERKGFIDLVNTNVDVEEDLGNETTFFIKPR